MYFGNRYSPVSMQITACWVYTLFKFKMEIRLKLAQQRKLLCAVVEKNCKMFLCTQRTDGFLHILPFI